jgi:hypothetical protein
MPNLRHDSISLSNRSGEYLKIPGIDAMAVDWFLPSVTNIGNIRSSTDKVVS